MRWKGSMWAGVACGAVLAVAGGFAVEGAMDTAGAQSGFTVSAEQLRTNQKISQAAVRRSNRSLNYLAPIRTQATDNADTGRNGVKPLNQIPGAGQGWTTGQIANGAITGAKLANGSVTNEKLGPDAVTGAKIAGGTITAANIAPGQVVKGNGELLSARLTLGPAATGNTVLLTLPNVANVLVNCTATGADTTIQNTSGTSLTASAWGVNAAAGAFAQSSPIASGAATTLTNPGVGGVQNATWQLSYGTGAAAHVATVMMTTAGTATPGTGCEITGQALTTN